MQLITILGSTGSVGQSTLNVISEHQEQYKVFALSACTNVKKMFEQCCQFKPQIAVMTSNEAALELQILLNDTGLSNIEVISGDESLNQIVTDDSVDSVMSAIVGAAGLVPTLSAVQAGKKVMIANKEPLVMTGDLFIKEARNSNATILPIDSEHNAIFQCLPIANDQSISNIEHKGVERIHLTASGGPFRGKVWADLDDITPDQACAHPNWSMGKKISVDSATMMNKGLELIEAAALFQIPADKVNIVIHPQSIIHSMVEYSDGSFLAQLGSPDMRIPIAHALGWPQRIKSGADTLDITEIASLDFTKPDMQNLPCLRLAQQAADAGDSAPAILNASNEIAVDAFLNMQIKYTDIAKVIEQTLNQVPNSCFEDIKAVLHIDNEARRVARLVVESL